MKSDPRGQSDLAYQKEVYVSWKKPEGGKKLVILNLKDGDFYSLEDPVSMGIWEQLMAGQTSIEILSGLARSYSEQDPAVLGRDLDAFIGELIENKLICARPQDGVRT
jgi:hypothetical protein